MRCVTVGNCLIAHTILLVSEIEEHFGCKEQHRERSRGGIYGAMRGIKGHVLEPERVVVGSIIGVFSWAQQVEKTNDEKVAAGTSELVKL